MAKPRKPKLVQHTPSGPTPAFQVIDRVPGDTYWHLKISDAILGDEPEFRYRPPKKGCPFTVHQLACAGAGELNEAKGLVVLQEVLDGIPTFTAVFASNGRQVFCVRSSDPERAKPVDLAAGRRWLAARNAA